MVVMTIPTTPKTKRQKLIWWFAFALGMAFIAYVVIKSLL